MRRILFVLVICGLTYGIYYAIKHKYRFMYKFNSEKEISTDSVKDTVNWKLRYESMYVDKIELENENESLKDSIYNLHKLFDRNQQTTINQPAKNNKQIKVSKPNEKILPIARSSAAMELKEFFTGRYSNR